MKFLVIILLGIALHGNTSDTYALNSEQGFYSHCFALQNLSCKRFALFNQSTTSARYIRSFSQSQK